MKFVTIIQKNSEHPNMYHGELLDADETKFRVKVISKDGLHEVWTCHYDYWNLIA